MTAKSVLAIPIVAGILLFLHVGLGNDGFDLVARVGAAALGTLAFMILRRATPTRLPFVPYAALQFYVFFGTPTFSEQRLKGAHGPIFVSQDAKSLAVWAAVFLLICIYAASTVGRRAGTWINPTFERFSPPGGILRLRGALRLWAIFTILLRTVLLFRPGGAIVFIAYVFSSPMLVQALLHREWWESRSPVSRLWFWGYTIVVAGAGLATGMLVEVMTPFLGAVVLHWIAIGSIPKRFLVALALAYVILAPAKYRYREETWNPTGRTATQVTLSERASAWVNALTDTWGGEDPNVEENVEAGAGRFSALMYVAQTFDWVPAYVPFTGLSRWTMIAYSYVPRVIWRTKPDLTRYYNGTYALTFDLLSERGTRTTAVGFFLISDGYWAAGWIGILLAGLVVGFLLGTYETVFRPKSWAGLAIGYAFLTSLQFVAHLAGLCGGILQGVFAFQAALWMVWVLAFLLSQRRARAMRQGNPR